MLRPARGFTLIELLVALVILTLLAIAGYRGLDAVLQTRERIAQETRKWQHLAFFFSRLEQDVAQAVHRPVRDAGGLPVPEWIGHAVVVDDDDGELVFTRAGIADQGAAMRAPQRIGYRLQQNTIVLLRWPTLDQSPRPEPVHYPLLEGVRDFQLRHLDINGTWVNQWPPAGLNGSLPLALEVQLTLVDGAKITRVFALQ